MPRVLALAQSAQLGGAEYGLLRVAGPLAERGFEIQLAVPADGPLAAAAAERGLRTHRLSVGGLQRGAWHGAVRALPRARRLLSEVGPDIVYFNGTVSQRLALGFPGATLVPHVHDLLETRPLPWRSRRFWRRAPVVLCDSRAVADAATAAGAPAGRTRVVGCPVEPLEPIARPEWAEGEVIGYVGRIEPRKGTLDLVRAAAKILGRRPAARLVMVGADEMGASEAYARRVRDEARVLGDRVTMLGAQPDAARLMAWFDVLCVPSLREPFGTVAAEALAAGTPVAATRSGGMPEYVAEGVGGALAAPGDPDDFAAAIERVLDGGAAPRDALRAAAAPFHPDRVADAIAAALRETL